MRAAKPRDIDLYQIIRSGTLSVCRHEVVQSRRRQGMKREAGDIVTGGLMVPMGLLGLLVASRAVDSEMYLFGLSLAAFAALFGFGLIKRHFDLADTQAIHTKDDPHV
jgi:hypothetical protein